MSKTIKAVYQDGVFRPEVPPELADGAEVRLTIEAEPPAHADSKPHLTGAEVLAIISKSWAKAKPGPVENVSENVDAYLYGVKGDPGDVR